MIWWTIIAAFLVGNAISLTGVQKPIKMTVYYESSSQESADFIARQLLPVWTEFSENIQLFLVPLAVTQQSYHKGHMAFKCRSGPKECEENALHVCALHEACGGMEQINCPSDLMTPAVDYIKCMVQSKNQKDAHKGCARKAWLSSTDIDECAMSWVGETLQSHYANITIEDLSLIKMELPHIVFDTYVKFEQDYARSNLRTLVCGLLPDRCWDSIFDCQRG